MGVDLRDPSLLIYTAGQISAVVSRPLILFLANNHLSKEAADGLAVVLLACTLSLTAIGADPHRRFYPRYFKTMGTVNGFPLFLYLGTITVMIGLGCGLVMAMGIGLGLLPLVAFSGGAYFLSEKLADEVLRMRLFEERLDTWGWATVWRAVLQLVSVGCFIFLLGEATPGWLLVSGFTLGNLLVFLPQVPRAVWRVLNLGRLATLVWLVKRGCRWLSGNRTLWVLALMGSGIAYLDRLIVVFVDRGLLPIFMLVSMCLSIVPTMVGAYYLNRNRRALMEQRLTVATVLTNRQFLGLLTSGIIIGAVASTGVLLFARNGDRFPLSYVLVIATLQVLVAVIGVLRDIPYWRGAITPMIRIEGAFYLLAALVLFTGWSVHLNAVWVFISVVGCVMVRLLMYLSIASPSGAFREG